MVTLSDLLSASQTDKLGDDQGPWRQFVLDHLDYIAKGSPSFEIDGPLMNLYRFDLKRFLKVYLTRQNDLEWIVNLLNNLHNDFEFYLSGRYIIPTDEFIKKLYHSYITIQSNSTT